MGDNYCDSCQDYMEIVEAPRPTFSCDSWNEQFGNWSAVQLWVYVIAGLIWIVWGLCNNCNCLGSMASHFAVGVLFAYLLAHLGWFIVVRKSGCIPDGIHPIVCVIMGIFYLLHGINWGHFAYNGKLGLQTGLHYTPAMPHIIGDNNGAIIRHILYGIYAVSLIYMGVAAIMICVSGQAGEGSRDVELGELDSSNGSARKGDDL